MASQIQIENAQPGSPSSQWDLSSPGSSTIEGFATDISVNRGQTINFKIDTDSTNYRIDIYRLGYYAGLGAPDHNDSDAQQGHKSATAGRKPRDRFG